MERQENESNGFEQFNSTKTRDHPPVFPEHFREQLKKLSTNVPKAQPKPEERSSSEIAASAEKLRAELAAIQAKKEALMRKKTEAPK